MNSIVLPVTHSSTLWLLNSFFIFCDKKGNNFYFFSYIFLRLTLKLSACYDEKKLMKKYLNNNVLSHIVIEIR